MARRAIAKDLLLATLIGVAYWLAVLAGLRWAAVPGAGTPFWPAAGIAFAGLLLGGSHLWPAILIARVAAAVAVGTPQPFWGDVLIGVATTLGAWVPVRLCELYGALDRRLGSMREMLWLALGGAVLGAIISATLGTGALWLSGTAATRVPYAWLNWASGFLVGVLTVARTI